MNWPIAQPQAWAMQQPIPHGQSSHSSGANVGSVWHSPPHAQQSSDAWPLPVPPAGGPLPVASLSTSQQSIPHGQTSPGASPSVPVPPPPVPQPSAVPSSHAAAALPPQSPLQAQVEEMRVQMQRMSQAIGEVRAQIQLADRQQLESDMQALRADLARSREAQEEMGQSLLALTRQLNSLQQVVEGWNAW